MVAFVLASEISHIFCCVLPILFSLFSLMAGAGMIGALPPVFEQVHAFMHGWEVPMIITSAVIMAMGWGVYYLSKKLDCHDTGCGHGPCEPRKEKAHVILKIASLLFLINVSVYVFLHKPMENGQVTVIMEKEHGAHAHHHE